MLIYFYIKLIKVFLGKQKRQLFRDGGSRYCHIIGLADRCQDFVLMEAAVHVMLQWMGFKQEGLCCHSLLQLQKKKA